MQWIFRAVARTGKVWGKGISQNVVWYVVKTCCGGVGVYCTARLAENLCEAVPQQRFPP